MNSRTAASVAHHVHRAKGNNSPSDDDEPNSGSFMYSIFLFRDNKTGKCTYSVKMMRIRITIVAVEMGSTQPKCVFVAPVIPYPTAFPYGNGMVLHFYQQQESSTTKTVHKVINKGLKTYV